MKSKLLTALLVSTLFINIFNTTQIESASKADSKDKKYLFAIAESGLDDTIFLMDIE